MSRSGDDKMLCPLRCMTPVEDMSCSQDLCAWWHSGKGECAFLVMAIVFYHLVEEFLK